MADVTERATLLRATQAAEALGVSGRTFRNLRGVPRVLLPGRGARPVVRYDADELRAWWRARLTHSVLDKRDPRAMRRVG